MTSSLLLVGCGKMGGALLERWQHKHAAGITRFDVIELHAPPHAVPQTRWFKSLDELPAADMPGVIVFAVKPQHLEEVLPLYKARFKGHKPLYLSIAAGKELAFYARHLGKHAHVVRGMPNTPALAGEGMTVLCAASSLPASARQIASELMDAVGRTAWLEDESLMDAVTAISGCGPAYVFLFLDAMVKAGVSAGLPEALAKALAQQTMLGSGALIAQSTDSLEQLRKNVTSPGGATQAALAVLMHDNILEDLMDYAVKAAVDRSKALSQA
jgi:pyrroline-5-carboxylate reductase